jgi:hypothetical protein
MACDFLGSPLIRRKPATYALILRKLDSTVLTCNSRTKGGITGSLPGISRRCPNWRLLFALRGELLAMALKFERLARFADDAAVPTLEVQPELND